MSCTELLGNDAPEAIVVVTYCQYGGYAILIPLALWFGVAGVGYYSSELVVSWLSVTYYPQMYINFVLKRMAKTRYPRPCRCGWDVPSWEAQLLVCFYVYLMAVNILRGARLSFGKHLGLVAVTLGVPVNLVLTGNASVASVMLGGFLGALIALALVVVLVVYIQPCFRTVCEWTLVVKMGYYNTLLPGLSSNASLPQGREACSDDPNSGTRVRDGVDTVEHPYGLRTRDHARPKWKRSELVSDAMLMVASEHPPPSNLIVKGSRGVVTSLFPPVS